MMGRQNGDQSSLFYEFRLDDRIPKYHLLGRINVFVTAALADVHDQLDPYYSEIGRPSVDPELRHPDCSKQACHLLLRDGAAPNGYTNPAHVGRSSSRPRISREDRHER